MKDYYEELWRDLPARLHPPDWELRRGFLLNHLRAGQRVLDLGCGEGAFAEVIAHAGASGVGVDVAEAALERARNRSPHADFRLVGEAGPLPFDEHSFDLVWASEVIEHVADTARWLSEARRVLAPGGELLLSTPAHGRLAVLVWGLERFSDPLGDHLHLYTGRSLGRLLAEFGFGEVSVRSAGGPPLLRRLLLARGVR